MSLEIYQNSIDQGAPVAIRKNVRLYRNRSFSPPFKLDSPERCLLGKEYWNAYSEQSYTYNFNSWGFRDCDLEQYRKENTKIKINVCIGDSFTMNIGGPAEHSWPHLLSKKLPTPVINMGIDCFSSYHYQGLISYCKKMFNVDQIFL